MDNQHHVWNSCYSVQGHLPSLFTTIFVVELFVKKANIIVTEKRAWAVAHDLILLIKFLNAITAFD